MAINKQYVSITKSKITTNAHLKYLIGTYVFNYKFEIYRPSEKLDLLNIKRSIIRPSGASFMSYPFSSPPLLFFDAGDYYSITNSLTDIDQSNKDGIFLFYIARYSPITPSKVVSGRITITGTDGLYDTFPSISQYVEVQPSTQVVSGTTATDFLIDKNAVITKENEATYGTRPLYALNLNNDDVISFNTSDDTPNPVSGLTITSNSSNNNKFRILSLLDNVATYLNTTVNTVNQVITTFSYRRDSFYHNLLPKYEYNLLLSTSTTFSTSPVYQEVTVSNDNPFDLVTPDAVAIQPMFDISQTFFNVNDPSKTITVQREVINNTKNVYANPRQNYSITSQIPIFNEDYTTTTDLLVWLPRTNKYLILKNKTIRYKMMKAVLIGTDQFIYGTNDTTIALVPYSNLKLLEDLGYTSVLSYFSLEDDQTTKIPSGELFFKRGSSKTKYKTVSSLGLNISTLPSFEGQDYVNTPLYQQVKGRLDVISDIGFTDNPTDTINEVLLASDYDKSGNISYSLGSYYIYPKNLNLDTNILVSTLDRDNEKDIVML